MSFDLGQSEVKQNSRWQVLHIIMVHRRPTGESVWRQQIRRPPMRKQKPSLWSTTQGTATTTTQTIAMSRKMGAVGGGNLFAVFRYQKCCHINTINRQAAAYNVVYSGAPDIKSHTYPGKVILKPKLGEIGKCVCINYTDFLDESK